MTEATRSAQVRCELAQLRYLEVASLVEASTLVLLVGVAVPLKHLAGLPLAVTLLGPLHGLAFAAYVWTVLQTVVGGGWRRSEWLRLVVTAFVPFAGYANLPLIRKKAEVLVLAQAAMR